MKQKIIAQGAEAKIIKKEVDCQGTLVPYIIKERISKGYRIKELDESIRKKRTKSEAKLLEKAGKLISTPRVLNFDKLNIKMDFISGERLSETLNLKKEEEQFDIMREIGRQTSRLHENDIIHGDLTTSNTILQDGQIFFIDFGLGFVSKRLEDKAVDLHLIKQALEAKHFQNWKELFKEFLKGYKWQDSEKVLEQLKKVEARGRYKH